MRMDAQGTMQVYTHIHRTEVVTTISRSPQVGSTKSDYTLADQQIWLYVVLILLTAGPGCSKLTMSLVTILLKFQTMISQIRKYLVLKKCEKLLH